MVTPLQRYILAGLSRAKYEFDSELKIYVASVSQLPGVVVQAKTIELAREELSEVIEDWVLLALQFGDIIPTLGGIKIPRVNSRKLTHA